MDYSPEQYKRAAAWSLFFSLLLALPAAALLWAGPLGDRGAVGAVAALLCAALLFAASLRVMMRRHIRRRRILARPFPPAWEAVLERDVVYFARLDAPGRERFRRMTQIFLGEHTVTFIGTDADDRSRVLAAAGAVIPVFALPEWEYRLTGEILIYPTGFDDDYRFSRRSDQLGQVPSESSAVILSKPDLVRGFTDPRDQIHVGVHEFLHKIDEQDGLMDGVPSLLADRETATRWREIIERESERIRKGKSNLDDYALTDAAEFFAVAGEYFFKKPRYLASRHPEIYALLKLMLRQDPAAHFGNAGTTPARRSRG